MKNNVSDFIKQYDSWRTLHSKAVNFYLYKLCPWSHTCRSISGRASPAAAILPRDWERTTPARKYWRQETKSPGWWLQSALSQLQWERWPATTEKTNGDRNGLRDQNQSAHRSLITWDDARKRDFSQLGCYLFIFSFFVNSVSLFIFVAKNSLHREWMI